MTLNNLDPKKHGSWKTWNKYRIKKYVWLIRELCFVKTMHNVTVKVKVFQAKNCSYNNSTGKCKSTSSVVYAFQVLCIIKNKINVSSHQIQPANNVNRQVWMSSFLNIRSSRPEVSCKKGVLKVKILQNSFKNIRDAVFHLIKFQAIKFYNFIEKRLRHMSFL